MDVKNVKPAAKRDPLRSMTYPKSGNGNGVAKIDADAIAKKVAEVVVKAIGDLKKAQADIEALTAERDTLKSDVAKAQADIEALKKKK